jgi:hypothetical protein
VLVTAEDGNRFARSGGNRIVVWTRVSDPDVDGAVAWAEPNVIELQDTDSLAELLEPFCWTHILISG